MGNGDLVAVGSEMAHGALSGKDGGGVCEAAVGEVVEDEGTLDRSERGSGGRR